MAFDLVALARRLRGRRSRLLESITDHTLHAFARENGLLHGDFIGRAAV